MTQEDKELLFNEISSKMYYGVNVLVTAGGESDTYQYPYLVTAISKFGMECLCKVYNPIYTPMACPKIEEVKPYLRSMSNMTKKEEEEFNSLPIYHSEYLKVDFYNSHHLDYRGLIEKGLALEAPEGMY